MTILDDESRFIVFKSDRRKEDDQLAIVGNTVYQCRDGFRMYAETEDGKFVSYGVYFGPQSGTDVSSVGGDINRRKIRFACLKE